MFAYANIFIACHLAPLVWNGNVEVLYEETFDVVSVLTSLYSLAKRVPVICERPFPIPYQERGAPCH